MSITASAGYTQYSESLINPIFSDRLIARAYCTTVAGDITNTEYYGDLRRSGDQVTFRMEPKVTIRDYQKNQVLEPEELESETMTLVIDQAKYFMVKVDRIDEKQIQGFDKWKNAFLNSASEEFKQLLDPDVLMRIALHADRSNKGNNAGKQSHAIELGEIGNPIPLTSTNIMDVITRLDVVLRESCRWEDGEMFLVLPMNARIALMSSQLTDSGITGQRQSPMLNGLFPDPIDGFDVYFTNNVPKVFDETTGKMAYWIVAGHKKATAFGMQMEESDVVKLPNSFGNYYRGLWVYGHKPFLTDALAAAYVTL